MSKIGELNVRFLSLSSLRTSRGGFLLAENALFTLPSLLNVGDSGTLRLAIAFLLSTRFATSLTFVFRFFSPFFQVMRAFSGPRQSLSTDTNASPAAP
jgi:hypothetical protein